MIMEKRYTEVLSRRGRETVLGKSGMILGILRPRNTTKRTFAMNGGTSVKVGSKDLYYNIEVIILSWIIHHLIYLPNPLLTCP